MSIYNAKATVKGKIHKVKEKCDKNLNNMNLANMNPAVFREPVFFHSHADFSIKNIPFCIFAESVSFGHFSRPIMKTRRQKKTGNTRLSSATFGPVLRSLKRLNNIYL